MRGEDKERKRRGLGEGSHFGLEISARGEGGGGKIGRTKHFGNSHRALLLLGTLGSGARKPQGFLELGSRRGCS
jgi:hypothetical protein